jgi:hypothetical protein
MPLLFNTILTQEGVGPMQVRLLRHQDTRVGTRRTPFELWRDNREAFEQYQGVQSIKNRPSFNRPYWASFVGDSPRTTLFVGLYKVEYIGVGKEDRPKPHMDGVDKAGKYDVYSLELQDALRDLDGKLYVDWGPGTRSWVQRAENKNKPVTEIRMAFKVEAFPGYNRFVKSLSEIQSLPVSWIEPLRTTKGVYLLTCPKTKAQYVGSATGADGFWGRWLSYVQTGHGGNVELKIREPSDYRVSILETAGSQLTNDEIKALEQLWKAKLQSKEMGLNKN